MKLFSRVRRARPLIFTRFGILYILFTIGIGAGAINTGNNLLYLVLGILLSIIILSGFLSDSSLWGLHVQWHPPAGLFAGQRATWRLEAHKGWFPSALAWIDSFWNAAEAERGWVPWVRQGTTFTTSRVIPKQRGWLELNRVRIGTPFPFGLFEKTYFEDRQDRWLVFPRIIPISDLALAADVDPGHQERESSVPGEGTVPYFLRDYATGDAMRRIHWKASLKRQRLMVKELEQDSVPGEQLQVAAWPADLTPAQTEDLISFIASVLWHSVRARQSLGLALPERHFAPAASIRELLPVLRFLALLQPAAGSSSASHGIDAIRLWRQYAAHR